MHIPPCYSFGGIFINGESIVSGIQFDEAGCSPPVRLGRADRRQLKECTFARLLHVFFHVALWRRRPRQRTHGKRCRLCRWFAGGNGLPPAADIN